MDHEILYEKLKKMAEVPGCKLEVMKACVKLLYITPIAGNECLINEKMCAMMLHKLITMMESHADI